MSNNLDNDRAMSTGKMYPIDLAPQKITIVKSVQTPEMKMAHIVPGGVKTTGTGQIITHTGSIGLMRPAPQIISTNVSSQPHMVVSSAPILQSTQISSQNSQMIGTASQLMSTPQLISASGQMLSPGTQIISQGTQLNAQIGNSGVNSSQVNISTGGSPVFSAAGQLVSGTGNLVVSSTVRTLPPSVRVLPPLPQHSNRPVLTNVSLNTSIGNSVVVSKTVSSHVPRGPAAGASLAVPRVAARPIAPVSNTLPISTLGGWPTSARSVRGAVVYSARARAVPPRPAPPRAAPPRVAPLHAPLSITAVPTTSVLTLGPRAAAPRAASPPAHLTISAVSSAPPAPAPTPPAAAVLTSGSVIAGALRAAPLVQRNYQPVAAAAKAAGAAGVRPVGNSAPPQLYYEVPVHARLQPPYHTQVNIVNTSRAPDGRAAPPAAPPAAVPAAPPRPSILRKRDADGSPTKAAGFGPPYSPGAEEWRDGGGSTTESAASSPEPEPEPEPEPVADLSPRKKPRKQVLSSDVRQCEFPVEEAPATPPPATVKSPPKRPQLSSLFVCGWRATALHFVRPADVRRREPRARDMLAIAAERHVRASADGWKVHHLTAQMDDLVSLESDVGEQLASLLRALETTHGKAQAALAPHSHNLLELVKGNIQRSRIVCEGVQEAREDILRVFTHRNFVTDILARQADKRCFRKHRSQS